MKSGSPASLKPLRLASDRILGVSHPIFSLEIHSSTTQRIKKSLFRPFLSLLHNFCGYIFTVQREKAIDNRRLPFYTEIDDSLPHLGGK